jgi:SAM-dependent methyltransferase
MTHRAGDRVQRYLLDGSDEDLKRLLGLAEAHGDMARTALRRSGIAPGWNVIECGCGPAGALVQLAELAGDTGRVTGVDLNPAAVDRPGPSPRRWAWETSGRSPPTSTTWRQRTPAARSISPTPGCCWSTSTIPGALCGR